MSHDEWIEDNVKAEYVHVGGKRVAVCHTSQGDGKPLILLLHGITGDRHGLVPLMRQLDRDFRCIIVEMPGHGESDFLPLRSSRDLQAWWRQVVKEIEASFGPVTATVAHSFGCLALSHSPKIRQIMLNPVPLPSKTYAQYAGVVKNLAPVIGHIYSMRLFVWLRVKALLKSKERHAKQNVSWVSKRSKPSYRQFIYQTKLTSMLSDKFGSDSTRRDVEMAVVGLSDTTAIQRDTLDFTSVFGDNIKLCFLRGGHLLPIEDPERVASLIKVQLLGVNK